MGKTFNAGIDTGYSDTKSEHTITPTGFIEVETLSYGQSEYLFYNDKYYIPDVQKFAYEKSRTDSEKTFILTLIAVAKEMIYTAKHKHGCNNRDDIQRFINSYDKLFLGVGLPPAYCAKQSEELKFYYKKYFKGNLSFCFNNFQFILRLESIQVYPQDYAAFLVYKQENGSNGMEKINGTKYPDLYAIDIGGYTVDLVSIVEGTKLSGSPVSIGMGVIKMFNEIQKKVETEFGKTITVRSIESVLRGQESIIKPEVKNFIIEFAKLWADQIINTLVEKGCNFEDHPVIFLGGGSKLLKEWLQENPTIEYCDFITSQNANAIAYTRLNKAYM